MNASIDHNHTLFERAQKTIPGGVNSPVRAFASVGGTPRFISRAQGARMYDANDKEYIDYIGSWGPMILGHGHPTVIAAVSAALQSGFSFGAPTEAEVIMAETLTRLLPSMEQVRLVSSGTEATMSAVRLARGFTGRSLLIKFEGCYHGHSDSLLVKAGSGLLTFGHPTSAGVLDDFAKHSLVLPYNDIAALEAAFKEHAAIIAGVIIEPVAGNMNLLPGDPAFLYTLRQLCTQHGALLIFDEVMCGFRVGLSGAQGHYGITPDITTLGKVIGGGFPMAAFGGRRDIMQTLAPVGAVYQAGTLSGNPVAVSAGLATLQLIQAPNFYTELTQRTQRLIDGLNRAAQKSGAAFCAQHIGSMFGMYFADAIPQHYADMQKHNQTRFKQFFHAMLDRGIYFAPSAFEAGFMSSAHTVQDVDATCAAAAEIFQSGQFCG